MKNNIEILLFEIHQKIEEYADFVVKKIVKEKDLDFLNYPPNCKLTELEKQELLKLSDNEHLKNALKKVIADNSAGVIFDMFTLFDGVADPNDDNWTGLRIMNEEDCKNIEFTDNFLHDNFFESYWDWKALQ